MTSGAGHFSGECMAPGFSEMGLDFVGRETVNTISSGSRE